MQIKHGTKMFDAMMYLTMAFMMEADMMMIMRAQSDEWFSGLASKVVKEFWNGGSYN